MDVSMALDTIDYALELIIPVYNSAIADFLGPLQIFI